MRDRRPGTVLKTINRDGRSSMWSKDGQQVEYAGISRRSKDEKDVEKG
jgi:hypothetical protein